MTEENKGGMDPKMLAAIQTRSIEQQTLDVLVRIEELVREALSLYKAPPAIFSKEAQEVVKKLSAKSRRE